MKKIHQGHYFHDTLVIMTYPGGDSFQN